MKLIRCLLTENDCYRTKRTIQPKGVMVHSTGADNPTLRRYVQPMKGGDGDYAALLARHCGDLGYGPQRVRQKLQEKGVPRELWDDALDALPDPAEQIDRFLRSKLRGELDEREKKRLSDALLRRGYAWSDVKAGLNRLGAGLWEE